MSTRSSFLGASASLAAAAALPAPAWAQSAQPALLPLRVATNPNDSYASAYYAQDAGFFTRAGLNVDLQTIQNGAAITTAVLAGSIDVGCAVPVTLASASLRGLPVVVVAACTMTLATSPATRLIVLNASPIKTAKDFEGKTVGINALGVGLELSFYVWLTANGGDRTKVKLVEVPFAEIGSALDRHTIDAGIIIEPSFTVAMKQFPIREVANTSLAIASQYIATCWFTTRDFAQQHPEHIRRFIAGIYEAQKWSNTHHAETAAILAKYSKVDLALARSMSRTTYADALRPAELQPLLDVAAKFGGLPAPVQAASLIYTAK